MALREDVEAASAPPAPGPSFESRRPPVVLWRHASREGQRQARIMGAGLGHSGHAVSPGPVAAPTPSSRGRHTAGLCQLPCRSAPRSSWPALPLCWCSEAEQIRRPEHPDQPFTARWPASLSGSALRSLRDSCPGSGLAAAAVPDCQWQLELGPGCWDLIRSLRDSRWCSYSQGLAWLRWRLAIWTGQAATDVRELKFTKWHCLVFASEFAREQKFPEMMHFSAWS